MRSPSCVVHAGPKQYLATIQPYEDFAPVFGAVVVQADSIGMAERIIDRLLQWRGIQPATVRVVEVGSCISLLMCDEPALQAPCDAVLMLGGSRALDRGRRGASA